MSYITADTIKKMQNVALSKKVMGFFISTAIATAFTLKKFSYSSIYDGL